MHLAPLKHISHTHVRVLLEVMENLNEAFSDHQFESKNVFAKVRQPVVVPSGQRVAE